MDELDILKQEMAGLKEMLDKEQIVNDRLMRTVMRQKTSWLNTFVKVEFIILPITFLVFVAVCAVFNISQWYAISFLILGGVDALMDLRTFRISPKIFSTCSMMEVSRLLQKQKKERFIHMCIAFPLAIVWIIMILNAIVRAHDPFATDHAFNISAAIGGVVGGLIGGVIVLIIYRKAQKTNDGIAQMINDEL